MPEYLPVAILSHCDLQEAIDLGNDVRAHPLPHPLGFAGRIPFIVHTLEREYRYRAPDVQVQTMNDAVAPTEPTALLTLPSVTADDPITAEDSVAHLLEVSATTLSHLTANSVEPVALALLHGSEAAIRPLPVIEPQLRQLSGYWAAAPHVQRACLADPSLALLAALLREAQRARLFLQGDGPVTRYDLRILIYGQFFDTASRPLFDAALGRSDPTDAFANRLRTLAYALTMDRLLCEPESIQFEFPPGKDFIDVIVQLRNAVAHEGEASPAALRRAPWAIPLLDVLPGVERAMREAARRLLLELCLLRLTPLREEM